MKIRNLDEGMERRVNKNRKLPRASKEEGLFYEPMFVKAAKKFIPFGEEKEFIPSEEGKEEERPSRRRDIRRREERPRFVDNRKRAILGRGEDPGFDEYDINEGKGCRGRGCGKREGFPTKRVREEEALERRDVPNMARRRPVGRKTR